MLLPAFSTVACPELTIDRAFDLAATAGGGGAGGGGYLGIELRTFGAGSRGPASDPALMAPEKVRALAERTGVRVCSLGTSCRFDEPVWPPVIGHAIADTERSIREAKWHVDLAVTLECPLVRVFAFEPPPGESTRSATARIAERLRLVMAHVHRTGVRVALENGGRYPTAARLMAIIDAVESPLLGVCYNVAEAFAAGETPENGLNVLGDRLLSLRVKDHRDGRPSVLGEGVVPVREAVERAARVGGGGRAEARDVPVIVEWDRMWLPELAPAERVLVPALRSLYDWGIRGAWAGSPSAGAAGLPARV